MSHIMSGGPKWVQIEKGFLSSDCTYDTKILMTGGLGGDISVCKVFLKFESLTKIYHASKCFI